MADKQPGKRRRSILKAAGPLVVTGLAGCAGTGGGGSGGGGSNGGGSGGGGSGGGGSGGGGSGGGGSGGGGDQQTYSWRIGTSGQETATHASGVAFSNIVSENSDMIEMSAQTTGGTTANPQLIEQGDIDIAQSTAPMVWRANIGEAPYDDPKLSTTFCQTFSYMTLDIFLVKRAVDKLADIKTVTDIPTDGSVSMSWGPRGTSGFDTMRDAFELSGVKNPTEKFDLKAMGLSDQAGAMRGGRLDLALVYTANTQTLIGWIQELGATTDIDIVRFPVDERTVQESGLPITYSEVPANVWEQDISVDSFPAMSMGYFTTIPAGVSAKPVYEFTNILMENKKEVRNQHAVLSEFGPEFGTKFLVKNGDVPVHPGTEKYLKENDFWSEDLTSLEDYQG